MGRRSDDYGFNDWPGRPRRKAPAQYHFYGACRCARPRWGQQRNDNNASEGAWAVAKLELCRRSSQIANRLRRDDSTTPGASADHSGPGIRLGGCQQLAMRFIFAEERETPTDITVKPPSGVISAQMRTTSVEQSEQYADSTSGEQGLRAQSRYGHTSCGYATARPLAGTKTTS